MIALLVMLIASAIGSAAGESGSGGSFSGNLNRKEQEAREARNLPPTEHLTSFSQKPAQTPVNNPSPQGSKQLPTK